jgi:hypothetical protein
MPQSIQELLPIPENLWLYPRDQEIPSRQAIHEKTWRFSEALTLKDI